MPFYKGCPWDPDWSFPHDLPSRLPSRSPRPNRSRSPVPSYHTVDPERIRIVNEEQAIVPGQATPEASAKTADINGTFLTNNKRKVRNMLLFYGLWQERTTLATVALLSGAQADMQLGGGATPIHIAAFKGNALIIRILLLKGVDIDSQEDHGWTPLDVAVGRNHAKAAKFLVSRRARVSYLKVKRAIWRMYGIPEDGYEQPSSKNCGEEEHE